MAASVPQARDGWQRLAQLWQVHSGCATVVQARVVGCGYWWQMMVVGGEKRRGCGGLWRWFADGLGDTGSGSICEWWLIGARLATVRQRS
ncbi:hypothetical protein CASFOL_032056 [Castilleja foliolosa]|uniref:Uncharacterized protein n=3 Tax=Castilleja foliolosa TaxID=1961234 RepID=A0ABD3C0D3_9LAMI